MKVYLRYVVEQIFQPRISLHKPEQPEPGTGAQPLLVQEQRARAVRGVHGQVEDHAQAGRHHRDHVGAQPVLSQHERHVLPDAAAQPGPHTGHAGLRHRHTVLRAGVRVVSRNALSCVRGQDSLERRHGQIESGDHIRTVLNEIAGLSPVRRNCINSVPRQTNYLSRG